MTLRKGMLIAFAVTFVITIVVPLLLWQYKPLRWFLMGTTMDMDNVRFYGRVIDQHGQPVAGAEVPYQLGGSALGGYRGEGKMVTDANGEFSIETEASDISLGQITHLDIEFGYPIPQKTWTTWSYSYMTSINFYGFQPQAGDNQPLWTDTSPEKPYVFRAWRIGKGEGEVARNLFEGEFGKKYEYGKVYTLNFGNQSQVIISEGNAPGHLRVVFERKADAEDVTQRWEARIIPVDDGIQETRDTYMNIAPESGYQPEIHIVRERISPDESIDPLSNQAYYFTANNGKTYGSLFLKFQAKSRNSRMRMVVRYKINPDGERILVKAPAERH